MIQVSRWGAREVGDRRHLRDNEELRGLLNCGHTRDPAFVVRLVGDDFTPRRFTVWGAKALAGIGHLADTVMDRASTNRVVIFDSALTPATFWVKLDELDLKPGAPVRKLELKGGKTYSGNAVSQFVDAKLFTFQDLTDVAPAK